jgi:hypothetical protein
MNTIISAPMAYRNRVFRFDSRRYNYVTQGAARTPLYPLEANVKSNAIRDCICEGLIYDYPPRE